MVSKPQPVLQTLSYGSIRQQRESAPDTLCVTTGRQIYLLGDIDGQFRPRSNPYDLHAFGKPSPDDPLANRLQGVWAQPVKGLAWFQYTVEVDGQRWTLDSAQTFTQAVDSLRFTFQHAGLQAERIDCAALDDPVLLTNLQLHSLRDQTVDLLVTFTAQFDLQDAWFTHLAERRNTGQVLSVERGCLVARARAAPERWAAVVGSAQHGAQAAVVGADSGTIRLTLHLEPHSSQSLDFGIAVVSQGGAQRALALLEGALLDPKRLREQKRLLYADLFTNSPELESPDPAFNAAFALACANLQMLEAEPPALGRCFYAGLEMFPFWFSNDGAYSVPGMCIAGLAQSALSHTRIGLSYLEQGRVPHQISPAGHVAFAGNAQETPLWVMSIWDAYRWTGDRAFLREIFPGAWHAMMVYVLGTIDPDGDGYPSGPGMVEVEGMGAEKLDSAAYTWAALHALAQMAQTLDEPEKARQTRNRAGAIAARFSADWWDAAGGTYAMSLDDPGNSLHPVPHWAVITPLEVGLAEQRFARATFHTMRRDYINRWGLKHTIGEDERVWTLPTAAFSRAAYRYGEPEMGFLMLRHIAETLQDGSIGLFHELIPQGACIIQLWSAATFLRGIVEDLLGITVMAAEGHLRIEPHLPEGWQTLALRNLRFGEHRVSVFVEGQQVRVVRHTPAALEVSAGSVEAK